MKRFIAAVTAAFTAASQVPCIVSQGEDSPLQDSGISYVEAVETIDNPGMGYTSTVWARCSPDNTPVYDPTGSLVLFFINIGGFSAGSNGTRNDDGSYTRGTDYPLDDTFFGSWAKTLENCRKNGCMAALRFRYDELGNDDPEPDSFEQLLSHVEQIKESGILEEYKDIIAYVECGFVGKWGEQHGGKYTSLSHKAQLLEAMLKAVPAPIPVTVRTPDIFAEWAGIKRDQLNDRQLIDSLTESKYSSDIQENKDRIGMYDDGYMGSNSDLGTYSNREKETDWLSHQTLTSYFGGEFSGNIDYAKEFDTYLPENAIPEMYKTHLSYINGNIFQLYKDYEFSSEYDTTEADNSAYYCQSVYRFIRDHIGYRFVLRDSRLTENAVQGGDVRVSFSVENTGFANVIPSTASYVILEKDGIFTFAEADTDCREWLSCTTTENELDISLPDNIPEGKWNVYLKLNMGTPLSVTGMSGRSIRFANENVWSPSMGANYLGSVNVTASDKNGAKNSLTASKEHIVSTEQYYTCGTKTVVDGMLSDPNEWTEDMLIGDNGEGLGLYAKSDENYIYFMSNVKNDADSPVYNLQLKNKANDESYWIYFASNGFVYFNHGDYGRSLCKWGDDMVEFRIPLDVMELSADTELDTLRIFMQDSGNEWKLMSDVRGARFTVKPDIVVLSAPTDAAAELGGSYRYSVVTELEGETGYEWRHNGDIIENAVSSELALENISAEDAGEYTVKITSSTGIEKTMKAFELTVYERAEDILYGDANCDGIVTIADCTLILQTLGNPDKYKLSEKGAKNADCFTPGDGVSGLDALAIQRLDAKLITSLPVTE